MKKIFITLLVLGSISSFTKVIKVDVSNCNDRLSRELAKAKVDKIKQYNSLNSIVGAISADVGECDISWGIEQGYSGPSTEDLTYTTCGVKIKFNSQSNARQFYNIAFLYDHYVRSSFVEINNESDNAFDSRIVYTGRILICGDQL